MTKKILTAPVGPSIHKKSYSKEYYLLQSLARANKNYQFEAYTQRVTDRPTEKNINCIEINPNSPKLLYQTHLYSKIFKEINSNKYDIYHHVKLSYNAYNPLLAFNLISDVPTVIGPAYPPHMVDTDSIRSYLNKMTGLEWPHSLISRSKPVIESTKNLANHVRGPLFAKTLSQADCVIVIDKATAEMYENFINRSKIEVIPFGIHVDRFNIGNPSQATDVVAIGNHIERKGFEPLLEAWCNVTSKHSDSTLQIYGDGPRRSHLEDKAEQLDIQDSVVFNGNVDHSVIRTQLANARMFVHPTLSEAQAHVRLEAMASGCPVVATNIRGTDEMIRDKVDGLVVPVNSVQPLSNAISRLLSDPAFAQELGVNARKRVEEKYDWEEIADQISDIYTSLV